MGVLCRDNIWPLLGTQAQIKTNRLPRFMPLNIVKQDTNY